MFLLSFFKFLESFDLKGVAEVSRKAFWLLRIQISSCSKFRIYDHRKVGVDWTKYSRKSPAASKMVNKILQHICTSEISFQVAVICAVALGFGLFAFLTNAIHRCCSCKKKRKWTWIGLTGLCSSRIPVCD